MTIDESNCAEEAVSYFEGGYNCAQSILLAMQKHWNIKNPLEPKVASAFGGGIGRQGSICGALTGGVIAIGLKYGTNRSIPEERERAYLQALKFYTQFKENCGDVFCKNLIGYDLTNPRELEQARSSNIFARKCSHFIEESIRILISLK